MTLLTFFIFVYSENETKQLYIENFYGMAIAISSLVAGFHTTKMCFLVYFVWENKKRRRTIIIIIIDDDDRTIYKEIISTTHFFQFFMMMWKSRILSLFVGFSLFKCFLFFHIFLFVQKNFMIFITKTKIVI